MDKSVIIVAVLSLVCACNAGRVTSYLSVADAGTDTFAFDTPDPTCGRVFGMCNFVSGAGCDGMQACYLITNTLPRCAAPGTGGAEARCTPPSDLDCQPGFACLQGIQRCAKRCCSDADCAGMQAPYAHRCFGPGAGGAGMCFIADCDPFALVSNGCPPDQPVCGFQTLADGSAGVACLYQNVQTVEDGQSCQADALLTTCHVGSVCLPSASGGTHGTCQRQCNLASPTSTPCPPGQLCTSTNGSSTNVGVCVLR